MISIVTLENIRKGQEILVNYESTYQLDEVEYSEFMEVIYQESQTAVANYQDIEGEEE